ncbi:DUF2905 domain-containing protein [Bacillus badius]|uniref:DUF2905 domain-containing protein n=1 Tax=Bacillus badius TaxID=1455 RepID=A0ABR5ATA5_BACBA|nr:DUF2905 domain-containing protein [Bacillus badius]KIL75446.1 hypothetical protein SD78_2515 [Bacillus badius]KIL77990.1 hypothetical protein SD77_0969 [Bacillus badius]MED0666300.1 DUF2905 domain-containing protein [Bacillus badius]MED4716421.1 DUF2905 domain-containing protein [Bacillus badius]OVE53065.1 hypothetical protein B1A98_05625 [Bacillus badius]
MSGIGKTLMLLGVILFVFGLVMQFVKIGRLPGDLLFKKGNTTFYFPIMTSIIVSVVLSFIFYVIGKWK